MQQLGCVVIVYHPKEDVVENIRTYAKNIDLLLIFDNTPLGYQSQFKQSILQSDILNIEYISNNQNLGIAVCLNKAATIFQREGINWMLTMDQDSHFPTLTALKYFEAFKNRTWNTSNVGMICLNFQRDYKENLHLLDDSYTSINTTITSGSIVDLSILEKLGGFEEKLFIDEVDHEYCFRLILHGYTIQCYHKLFLIHNLGSIKSKGYLWGLLKKRNRVIHSPIRLYFIVRNYNFVSKKYSHNFKSEFSIKKKQLYTTLKNNLLFSNSFLQSVKYIALGYFDYLTNNYKRSI